MNKKVFTISIITLLALAIAASFLWFAQNGGSDIEIAQKVGKVEITPPASIVPPAISPTPTPQKQIAQNEADVDTSNWKTYINEEYGFSLRYPEGCAIYDKEYVSEEKTAFLDCYKKDYFMNGTIPENAKFFGSMYVYYANNETGAQYVNKKKKECLGLGMSEDNINIKKIVINNKEAVVGGCSGMGDPTMTAIFDGNKRVEFVGDIQNNFTLQKDGETVIPINGVNINNQVYKTLKFDASWKTYTNEEHGFSLRYPEGWDVKEDRYQVSKNVIAIARFTNSKIEDGFFISVETHKKSFNDYINDLKKDDLERQKRSNELFESNNSFSDSVINGRNVIFSNGYAGPIGSFYKMYIPYNQGRTIIFSGGQKKNLESIYKTLKFQ